MKFKVNKSSHFQLLIFNFQLLLLLASCGPHDTTPDGLQPVTFTATVDGLARGTTENNWENLVDRAVAVEIDGVVKKYTVAADGSLTPADAANTFYWKNRQITVSAWYPYAATKPDMIVQPDQSDDGYEKSDLLEAVPSMLTFGENTPLAFTHRAARVTVTLAAGDDIADVSGASGVLFMNLPGVSDGTIVTPCVTDADGTRTYSALLAPGTIGGTGNAFLCVVLDDNTYYYTPDETILAAGIQYNYDITVGKTGLTLASSSISAWTDGDGVIGQITEMTAVDFSAGDAAIMGDNGNYYVTGDHNGRKLTISGSPTLYLINAKMTCDGDSPITIESGSPTIVLVGTNELTSTGYSYSALYPARGATLTLLGNGSLTAKGGYEAAGIGGGSYSGSKHATGIIIIKSGMITATSGQWGAAIGSGAWGSSCEGITILGGDITATGGLTGAGIGSGTTQSSCGNITISGGKVKATGNDGGAGIGNGAYSSCGTITISGGDITAESIFVSEAKAAAIGNGFDDERCESITLDNCVIRIPGDNGVIKGYNGIQATGSITPTLEAMALKNAGVELYVNGKLYK